jgi:hypothetical protein
VRDALLQSLRAGVVPRVGQQHIQVGRKREVTALLQDIERVGGGGSTIRFIIGAYGSGKTFFLQLIRTIAQENKLVTAHADLGPDRRLHATGGQAQSLYQELMRNLATRSQPDGGAMSSVVERFVTSAITEGREKNRPAEDIIRARLKDLTELVGGYDFAEVIAAYFRGYDQGKDALRDNAVRWLRGEYTSKTEARQDLGVRTIVDDATVYDQLKVFALFCQQAGFGGLLVGLDELVNLYKLNSGRARQSNYEQILRILNDSLQGTTRGLGFVLGGTPEFLYDTRKGLYSYEALQSRLATNAFAVDGLVDLSGPVIQLENLSPEDLYLLLQKLRHVHASGDATAYAVPDEALVAFLRHCSERIGDAYFRTPRNTIRAFIDLLEILLQNPNSDWSELLGGVALQSETDPSLAPAEGTAEENDDELTSFRL